MIMSKKLILTLFSVLFRIITSTGQKKLECPAKQEILCETLRTTKGFTYVMPMIPNSRDCEYGWYKNGTCIAHSDGGKLPSVVSMTEKDLTVAICEDLQWQLRCGDILLNCIVDYKVIQPEKKQDANHNGGLPGWGIALTSDLMLLPLSVYLAFSISQL